MILKFGEKWGDEDWIEGGMVMSLLLLHRDRYFGSGVYGWVGRDGLGMVFFPCFFSLLGGGLLPLFSVFFLSFFFLAPVLMMWTHSALRSALHLGLWFLIACSCMSLCVVG